MPASTSSPSTKRSTDAAEPDSTVERILEASLELFADIGVRKTTLEDVAKRAGVDRVTVYRRIGSKDDLVREVTAREAQRVFMRVAQAASSTADPDERVVKVFTTLIRDIRGHALLSRLLQTEPDTTLPKVTTEAGEMVAMAVHLAAEHIAPKHDTPHDLNAELARIEIVVRLVHSLCLTGPGVVDLSSEKKLAAFARDYVAPIVNVHRA